MKNGKPDPEGFQLCSKKLKVPIEKCIIFEDSFSGLEAALYSGARYIGINTSQIPESINLHASVISPNKLNRQFNPEKLNRYWSGDITYIRTGQGWLYLAVILDLCSRRVISWAFSDKPNSELTTRVLRLAVQKRQIKGHVIFHSDQGCQYTSDPYTIN